MELGSQDYNSFGRLDGKAAGAMAVYLLPGANQLAAAEGIYETMRTAKTFFPSDMDYRIVYDTTPAVEASIESIFHTFLEAVVLVTLVVFIFLQNLRATIIPLLTVPVSLIGTFIFFPMLGFSVNTLSMFGLVLAIGIVVDDAIVVVEAVMHHIEHGMAPKEATIQAMKEVSAPVIGIALILSAVFIPVAFIPGLTGQMYQQFALTIAISVLLSAFSALSLSPALAAMLLKPAKPATGILGKFFGGFNKVFERATSGYVKGAQMLVRRSILTIGIVVLVAVGAGLFGGALPAGFIPEEDQGIFGVNVTLPPAASLERTSAVLAQVEEILGKTEGVESYQTIGGYGVVTSTYQPNFGTIFVRLKPWHDRHGAEMHVRGFMARIQAQVARIPDAIIFPFNIPTISGFGASAGFNFLIQDRSGSLSVERLGELSRQFGEAARKRPEIGNIFTSFDPRYPQVNVVLDREKARKLGVPGERGLPGPGLEPRRQLRERLQPLRAPVPRLRPVRGRLPAAARGHRRHLGAQQDHERDGPARDARHHHRPGRDRAHEPLQPAALGRVQRRAGRAATPRARPSPPSKRPSRRRCHRRWASPTPRSPTRRRSPRPPRPRWWPPSCSSSCCSPPCTRAGGCRGRCCSARRSSPSGRSSACGCAGYDNNVYVQIGNIMLIGLAAKNAILIVEFAKAKHEKDGMGIEEAALESARLRFRPILMTAFAFILGVIPLMKASGAGAGAQNVMGTAVFWGMLVATALGVFLIPGNYAFVELLGRKKKESATGTTQPLPATSHGGGH